MRKIFLIVALAAFTAGFAQENKNINRKKETVITKTRVTDNQGEKVSSKSVSTTEKQKLLLDAENPNKVNQDVVMTPIKVNTNVTYGYEGNRFQFLRQKDTEGYRLMSIRDNATNTEYAVIKPTSQEGYYIYSQDGKSSFGFFNEDGDFVIESYDPQSDSVKRIIYQIQGN